MKLPALSLLLLCVGTAHAADPAAESCAQIRAQIAAHVGVPERPSMLSQAPCSEGRLLPNDGADSFRSRS